MKLKKRTTSFVNFSDIRSINENVSTALDVLCDSSPPWTWGDNNRTLIDVDSFLSELESSLSYEDGFVLRDGADDDDTDGLVFIEDVIEQIRESIPVGVDYVDLEN
jgi:hypothetical protein